MSKIKFRDISPTLIRVWVDGGCLGQGTPSAKCYGSVLIEGERRTRWPLEFENATTNNEAEYGAVLSALDMLKTLFLFKGPFVVELNLDSALVYNQVWPRWVSKTGFGLIDHDKSLKPWKTKSPSMKKLCDAVLDGLGAFRQRGIEIYFRQISGDEMKSVIGH